MIDWLIQSATAHSALARGVAPAGMLSAAEQQRLAALTHERRRRDWLLGRWATKRLVQRYLARRTGQQVPLDALTIASAPDGSPLVQLCEEAGRPAVSSKQSAVELLTADCLLPTAYCTGVLQAAVAPLRISISHSAGLAYCALADEHTAIGVDIERIVPRGAQFAADYFTPGELAQLAAAPAARYDTYSTLIWSAKEAALKALRLGLTVDTREVAIELGAAVNSRQLAVSSRQSAVSGSTADCQLLTADSIPGWAPLRAHYRPRAGGQPRELHGWWRVAAGFALTLALTQVP